MRIFYDFELCERGPELPIQPISVGLVREDGRELYLINEACLPNVMRHPWLSVNVRPSLPIREDGPFIYEWDAAHPEYPHVVNIDVIADLVGKFITEVSDVELWGYFAAYDHVALCQLFGSMIDLPAGVPMFTCDIQQMIKHLSDAGVTVDLPPQPEVSHHAMWDARWNQQAFGCIYFPERQFGELPEVSAVDMERYEQQWAEVERESNQ